MSMALIQQGTPGDIIDLFFAIVFNHPVANPDPDAELMQLVFDRDFAAADNRLRSYDSTAECEAELLYSDSFGRTPLQAAGFYNAPYEVLHLMVSKAAQSASPTDHNIASFKDRSGWGPLACASFGSNDVNSIKLLVRCYPEALEQADENGDQPLAICSIGERARSRSNYGEISTLLRDATAAFARLDHTCLIRLVGASSALEKLEAPHRRATVLLCMAHVLKVSEAEGSKRRGESVLEALGSISARTRSGSSKRRKLAGGEIATMKTTTMTAAATEAGIPAPHSRKLDAKAAYRSWLVCSDVWSLILKFI
jgi:hypothetical protein